MIEELRRELIARKAEFQQIKWKTKLLFSGIEDSMPIYWFEPKNQSDIENIRRAEIAKPMIIDLSGWPVEREFVLGLLRNSDFVIFTRSSFVTGEVKVRLLDISSIPRSITNLKGNVYDVIRGVIDFWKRKNLADLSFHECSRTKFVYGDKIIMLGGTAVSGSGSSSSSNIQTRNN